jgi:hypothetical protein
LPYSTPDQHARTVDIIDLEAGRIGSQATHRDVFEHALTQRADRAFDT